MLTGSRQRQILYLYERNVPWAKKPAFLRYTEYFVPVFTSYSRITSFAISTLLTLVLRSSMFPKIWKVHSLFFKVPAEIIERDTNSEHILFSFLTPLEGSKIAFRKKNCKFPNWWQKKSNFQVSSTYYSFKTKYNAQGQIMRTN